MSGPWTELQRYVIEEHFEEYAAGRISRRELLRRVSYITGGAAASLAALSALGCNVDQPRAVATGPATAAGPGVHGCRKGADIPCREARRAGGVSPPS